MNIKLYTHCKSCRNEITIKSNAATRPDLQMEKGDEFVINCMHCGKMDKKHVNDVKAEPNKVILISGIILALLVAICLFIFYGLIGTLTFTLPILFWKKQESSASAFNRFLVRRK
ncbi:hypothetical protein [Mangrovimonas xylaniphaga]|uniref:hypothetical protein n=1 Tax=Mangrovimonas xylaniphaga TaxID=1645915 RepID=UPI0006B496AE|nr:hypothetical protein [Mangrovimonas xylaniphaga]